MPSAELATPTAANDTRYAPIQLSTGAPNLAGRPYPFDATDPFRREDLSALLAGTGNPAISIFLPTHRLGREIQQDPACLRGLLSQAEARLEARGLGRRERQERLAPAAALLDEDDFWRHQADGLALFLAPELFRTLRLATALPERVIAGERFAVRPLLPALEPEETLWVLALSLRQVRLLEVSARGIRRVEDARLPSNMDQALGYDAFPTGREMHTVGPRAAAPGRNGGISHGHGDGDEENYKTDQLNYFRAVVRALVDVLPERNAPLVLATVEEHVPRFESAMAGHLPPLAGHISGGPDAVSDEDLGRRGQEILAVRQELRIQGEIDRYRELAGSQWGLGDLGRILPAALEGRVETLFLAEEAELYGYFDRENMVLTVHEGSLEGEEDLAETAVREVFRTGGQVIAVPRARIPGERNAGAILRY